MDSREALEQGSHAVRTLPGFALGRGHHLLDHGTRKPLAGQRRDIARIDTDMQAMQMRVPDPRYIERRR